MMKLRIVVHLLKKNIAKQDEPQQFDILNEIANEPSVFKKNTKRSKMNALNH